MDFKAFADSLNCFSGLCHSRSRLAGWWTDRNGRDLMENELAVPAKFMLTVSEIAEAMEGDRKDKMDDKLPHRSMIEVEIADAFIRLGDLAGALNLDVGGAIAEKMEFNVVRPDHQMDNRRKVGGKKY